MQFVFDGTYSGYLTCLFDLYDQKKWQAEIVHQDHFQPSIFGEHKIVITDEEKANRVVAGLVKTLGREHADSFFRVFLSEDPKAWQASVSLFVRVFKEGEIIFTDYGNDHVLYFTQTLKKIRREAHRMKAFIRFSKDANGLFMAVVEPDFNVLPLIIRFFKNTYTDQEWLIYDRKRQYGLFYNRSTVEHVTAIPANSAENIGEKFIELDTREEHFQSLWQHYFTSTNIKERINLKLHLKHVPKRYWKYLVEKM